MRPAPGRLPSHQDSRRRADLAHEPAAATRRHRLAPPCPLFLLLLPLPVPPRRRRDALAHRRGRGARDRFGLLSRLALAVSSCGDAGPRWPERRLAPEGTDHVAHRLDLGSTLANPQRFSGRRGVQRARNRLTTAHSARSVDNRLPFILTLEACGGPRRRGQPGAEVEGLAVGGPSSRRCARQRRQACRPVPLDRGGGSQGAAWPRALGHALYAGCRALPRRRPCRRYSSSMSPAPPSGRADEEALLQDVGRRLGSFLVPRAPAQRSPTRRVRPPALSRFHRQADCVLPFRRKPSEALRPVAARRFTLAGEFLQKPCSSSASSTSAAPRRRGSCRPFRFALRCPAAQASRPGAGAKGRKR